MSVNNFDISSSGVDISLVIFPSAVEAQSRFDESFETVGKQLVYAPWAESGDIEDEYIATIHGEKTTMLQLAAFLDEVNNEFYSYVEDIACFSHRELLFDAQSCLQLGEFNYDDVIQALDNNGIQYELLGDTVAVVGCNQGDYAEVYVPLSKLREEWGNPGIRVEDLRDTIHNLLWLQPIYVCLTVDGTDFYGWESDIEEYEYNCEEYSRALVKDVSRSGLSLDKLMIVWKFLKENMPDYV